MPTEDINETLGKVVLRIVGNEFEGNANRVIRFIQENPGCHLRQIKNELKVSVGTVQYHLNKLEKMGNLTFNRYGSYKCYFPIGVFKESQKDLLKILSQETAREILMFIIEQKNPTQTDIVNKVGISNASINWHIKKLISLKVIDEIKEGKYKRYQIHDSPGYTLALLKNYYPNIWDMWSARLIELFLSLSSSERK
jgi:predicted transcriptional regulator